MTAIRKSLASVLSDMSRKPAHAGLLLSRYSPDAVGKGTEQSKNRLLGAAIQAASQSGQSAHSAIPSYYQAAFARWKMKWEETPATERRLIEVETTSRIIVGLGGDNVTETGLALHHTYGVPYLPGAAIKGLAAHYAHQVWGTVDSSWRMKSENHRETGPHHAVMFGCTDGDEPVGGLIDFSDGWIVDPTDSLILDVMTPHHGDYYMADKNVKPFPEPTDFDSPIPVPFLAVKGKFLIALSKRDKQLPEGWLQRAAELVTTSLEEWGIGGKTNADYGRLRIPSPVDPGAPRQLLPASSSFQSGQMVTAVVLERTTKGGGRIVEDEASGICGAIVNNKEVPAEVVPGDRLKCKVRSRNPKNASFDFVARADS